MLAGGIRAQASYARACLKKIRFTYFYFLNENRHPFMAKWWFKANFPVKFARRYFLPVVFYLASVAKQNNNGPQ